MALRLQIKKVSVLVPSGLRRTRETAAAGEGRELGGTGAPVEDRSPSGADANTDSDLPVLEGLCISVTVINTLRRMCIFAERTFDGPAPPARSREGGASSCGCV